MIRIGILGIGFMGTAHFIAAAKLRGAKVTAIATRDETKWTGEWGAIKGNFGAGGGKQDLTDIAKYRTLDEMLEDPAIDLVDICIPTNAHRAAAIKSLEAGKHVLVEKPLALTLADAQAIRDAAKASGKKLFVAHVLRFMPAYKLLRQVVNDDTYGKPVSLHLKRMVSSKWQTPDWLAGVSKSGGPVLDLLIHDADFLQFTFGMPSAVFATAHVSESSTVYYTVQFIYEGRNLSISTTGGVAGMPVHPFEQGYDYYAENAYLRYNSLSGQPLQLLSREGQVEEITIDNVDPIMSEMQYVVDSLNGIHDGSVLGGASAARSLSICLAIEESIRTAEIISIPDRVPMVSMR